MFGGSSYSSSAFSSIIVTTSLVQDGFRILENGDYRVIESNDFRITEKFIEVFSNLQATGTCIAVIPVVYGNVNINGSGILISIHSLKQKGFSSLSAQGSVILNSVIKKNGIYLSGGIASMTVDGTRIPFTSTVYVKDSIWKTTTPYVKYEGLWKIPEFIFIKRSGMWRRVY